MSNIEVGVLKVCEEKLNAQKRYSADWSGNFTEISPYLLMIKTIEMFYSWLDRASNETWKVFHMSVDETSKEKIAEQIEKRKAKEWKVKKNMQDVEQREKDILAVIREEIRNIKFPSVMQQPTQFAQSVPLQQTQNIPVQQAEKVLLPIEENEEEIITRKPVTIWWVRLTAWG